jgi:hypothetical protein
MLTLDLLAASGILKSRLWHYLNATTEDGISRMTLNKRLRDQKWTYEQVLALKQAGVWVEPPHKIISQDDISLLYADLRGGPLYIASQVKKRKKEAKKVIAGYGSNAI